MTPQEAGYALKDDIAMDQEWVREHDPIERDQLIISTTMVEGVSIVTSRYGDSLWQLNEVPNNGGESARIINFKSYPKKFQPLIKEIIFRYMRRGRAGLPRPKGNTIKGLFDRARRFFAYIDDLKVDELAKLSPLAVSNYINNVREHKTWRGKKLSNGSQFQLFVAVEAVYELSQYTSDPMPFHPWPETSASGMTGFIGSGSRHRLGGSTPLMPDDIFCGVFEMAHRLVSEGKELLDFRDIVLAGFEDRPFNDKRSSQLKTKLLAAAGWKYSYRTLKRKLLDLRTACYIIIATTSGCRNHEIANLKLGAHHRTENDEGEIFHWIRAESEKTQAGVIDWMVPSVAVTALRIMERWAEPYQAAIREEIRVRRKNDSLDPQIAEAQKHMHALFLGASPRKDNQVRTLGLSRWTREILAFGAKIDPKWNLTSHQFRRKFANYAAHSKFGDLRYLREHFAHWSMDMTIGYAMDENWGMHLDVDLYAEIEEELNDTKSEVVESWIDSQHLAGEYGASLKRWQREPQNLTIFKSRASMIASIAESTNIRSNGHAWCTADDDGCVGNTIERSRCGGCKHSVISAEHTPIYVSLHKNLAELLECKDIGDVGLARVQRDLSKYRSVLSQLHHDLETELE